MPEPLIRTPEQYQVALAYGRGLTGSAIVDETGVSAGVVNALAEAVGFDRGRARTAAADYDRQRAAVAATRAPRDPAPAATPASRPVEAKPSPVDQLLVDGERSSVKRVRALAERIRQGLTELGELVDQTRAEEQARALVAERRRALDEAETQLRAVTGKPARQAHPVADTTKPTPAAVRTWATANGVPCGTTGRVPATAVAAYKAAHQ